MLRRHTFAAETINILALLRFFKKHHANVTEQRCSVKIGYTCIRSNLSTSPCAIACRHSGSVERHSASGRSVPTKSNCTCTEPESTLMSSGSSGTVSHEHLTSQNTTTGSACSDSSCSGGSSCGGGSAAAERRMASKTNVGCSHNGGASNFGDDLDVSESEEGCSFAADFGATCWLGGSIDAAMVTGSGSQVI